MGGRDMSIVASSYMQIFLNFDFSEIASWNIERNILISKKCNRNSRLVASINPWLPYINPNHAMVFTAGKVVSQEQLCIPLRA